MRQLLCLLALCLVFQVQADSLLGKVINVADGDTITVLDDTNTQHKIRLSGIDAPEKRQAFGNISIRALLIWSPVNPWPSSGPRLTGTGASRATCCWPVWIPI